MSLTVAFFDAFMLAVQQGSIVVDEKQIEQNLTRFFENFATRMDTNSETIYLHAYEDMRRIVFDGRFPGTAEQAFQKAKQRWFGKQPA